MGATEFSYAENSASYPSQNHQIEEASERFTEASLKEIEAEKSNLPQIREIFLYRQAGVLINEVVADLRRAFDQGLVGEERGARFSLHCSVSQRVAQKLSDILAVSEVLLSDSPKRPRKLDTALALVLDGRRFELGEVSFSRAEQLVLLPKLFAQHAGGELFFRPAEGDL